jgi:hypothetical protein
MMFRKLAVLTSSCDYRSFTALCIDKKCVLDFEVRHPICVEITMYSCLNTTVFGIYS